MDATQPTSTKEEDTRSRDVRAIRVFLGFVAILGLLAFLALVSYVGAYMHFHFNPISKP